MNKSAALAGIVWLAGLAAAQGQTSGNVFVGYSYENVNLFNTGRSNFNGWQGSVEGKVIPGLGIVADFSGHYGSGLSNLIGVTGPVNGCSPVSSNAHVYEAMLGPPLLGHVRKVPALLGIELGVAHVSTDFLGSSTSFSGAAGGGLDYRIVRPLAWRVQAGYVDTFPLGVSEHASRGDGPGDSFLSTESALQKKQDSAGWLNPVFCGHEQKQSGRI